MVTSSLPLVQYPVSLRLNRKFSENLSRRESKDAEQLRKDVGDNVSVWLFVGGHLHYSKSASHHCVTVSLFLIFNPAQWDVQAYSWGPEGAKYLIQVRFTNTCFALCILSLSDKVKCEFVFGLFQNAEKCREKVRWLIKCYSGKEVTRSSHPYLTCLHPLCLQAGLHHHGHRVACPSQ